MKGEKATKQTKTASKELRGHVDLRRVRLTEMPLKELLRSLWWPSLPPCFTIHSASPLCPSQAMVVTRFRAET